MELLSSYENARVLAGGQTLVNVMKLRTLAPERVVDISRIPELRGIAVASDGSLEIGAAATYSELIEAVDVWAVRPILAEVALIIADVQVRNCGTIGGNACLNMPTSHFPPALVAVGAELTIAGRGGERTVAADDFFVAPFSTAVGEGEVLTRIRVPARRDREGDAFAVLAAGKEGQSIVHAAASLRLDGGVAEARVVIGCVGPAPVRAAEAEARLLGTEADEETVRAAVQGLGATLSPPSDVNATDDFRRHAAEVLAERAVLQAAERAREAR